MTSKIPSITLKDGTIVRYVSARRNDGRRHTLWQIEYPDGQRVTKAVDEPPDVDESIRLLETHRPEEFGDATAT